MYKLSKNSNGDVANVIRLLDNACIPYAPDNTDYQVYLEWLAKGNEPEAADV